MHSSQAGVGSLVLSLFVRMSRELPGANWQHALKHTAVTNSGMNH